MILQGSCLSTLLCSLFLADLESSHLQDLLPRASWHPSARMHPHPTPRSPHNGPDPTSSSAARLTDLAQAADTGMQLRASTRSSQQYMGTSSWDEVQPQVSSVDPDCGSGQEEHWLTQQMQSAHEALPLTGSREALAGTESAAAQSAGTESAGAQSAAAHSVAALSAAAQSAGSHGVAHGVQSVRAAPSQPPADANWRRDNADHRLMKRPRRSLSKQQLAHAGSGVQQQTAPPSRSGAACAAGLDWCQQGSMSCEGAQRDRSQQGSMACEASPWQGQPGHSEDHEHQSHPCEAEVPNASVQQSSMEAVFLRKGVERRAPRLQSLLMRLIDDFLFITPSRTAAEALVNKLLKGAPLTAHHLLHGITIYRRPFLSGKGALVQGCLV